MDNPTFSPESFFPPFTHFYSALDSVRCMSSCHPIYYNVHFHLPVYVDGASAGVMQEEGQHMVCSLFFVSDAIRFPFQQSLSLILSSIRVAVGVPVQDVS